MKRTSRKMKVHRQAVPTKGKALTARAKWKLPSLSLEHLVKLQRLILRQSKNPSRAYSNQLLRISNPATEADFEKFEVEYLLHNLFRKLVIPEYGCSAEERKQNAIEAFKQGEDQCRETNERLKAIPQDRMDFIHRLRGFIAGLLGPLDYDKLASEGRFSKGATATRSRRDVRGLSKFCFANPSCTIPAFQLFSQYIWKEDDHAITGMRGEPNFISNNRIEFVPKSNETDRTIAAEPDLNMFFQLGAGSLIRKRLRRYGINLNDQSINQKLARQGSIDGSLATIDLANASNSLSYEAVKCLLPWNWFSCLDALRSPYGLLDGETIEYNMFSSMGNGYTFELESLIFFAICKVTCPKGSVISVYGDDIIVPTESVEAVVDNLAFLGFSTNKEKTFSQGPFRESCGKHYLNGADVSPFFVRSMPKSLDVFLLYNNMVRWSLRDGYFHPELEEALDFLESLIPEDSRIYGPDGYGDGHMLPRYGRQVAMFKHNCHLQQLTFWSYVRSYDKQLSNQVGALCATLLSGGRKRDRIAYSLDEDNMIEVKASIQLSSCPSDLFRIRKRKIVYTQLGSVI